MLVPGFVLVIGLVGLAWGADLTLRGATSFARRHNLNDTFVGLAILSVGTDLPEIAIAVDASVRSFLDGTPNGIVLGSAVGSAIAQISLVTGLVGLVGGLKASPDRLGLYGLGLIGGLGLLFLTALGGNLSRLEGLLLFTAYIIFFAMMMRNRHRTADPAQPTDPRKNTGKAWLFLAVGLALLLVSAELSVGAALSIALELGISEATVSVVFLGLGSSIPELSVSVWALARKRVSLSMGNLMGSNILDTLLVPGLAGLISPYPVEPETIQIDMPVQFILTLLVLVLLWRLKDGLRRLHALAILSAYLIYVAVRFGSAGAFL